MEKELGRAVREAFPDGRPAGHVVAAVSGGADSLALLWLLAHLRTVERFELTAVHVDHGLRAATAREAALVRATADNLGARFELATIGAIARSDEATLREARYAALEAAADRLSASWITTGHTRDDQIETILFRLLRGSGRGGLAGIPRIRGRILRPLLTVERDRLRTLLSTAGIGWIEDPSNRDPRYARNRIRRVVVPTLERELGAGRVAHLADVGTQLADEDTYLETETTRFAAFALRDGAAGSFLDLSAWQTVPQALRPRLIRRWLERLEAPGEIGLAQIKTIERLANDSRGSSRARVAGLEIVREYTTLQVRPMAPPPSLRYDYEVSRHRSTTLAAPDGAWQIAIDTRPAGRPRVASSMRRQVVDFTAEVMEGRVSVRSSQAGDTIRLSGYGTRKVHDIMVDSCVPTRLRADWPVLASDSRLLWVPGLAVAEGARARDTGDAPVRFGWHRVDI